MEHFPSLVADLQDNSEKIAYSHMEMSFCGRENRTNTLRRGREGYGKEDIEQERQKRKEVRQTKRYRATKQQK